MNFDDFMMKTLSAMTPIILICQLGSRVKLLKGLNTWKCKICGKSFENVETLNYHTLLEHSEHKRPPIGIG